MPSSQPPEPNDLDSILDDALDAFDNGGPVATDNDSTTETTAASATAEVRPSREERVVPPGSDDDDAARALEEALRTLEQLNMSSSEGTGKANDADDVTEEDMKLVEGFITSLGQSLNGLNTGTGTDTGASDVPNSPFSSQQQHPSDEAHAANAEKPEAAVEQLVESIVGHLLSEDVLKEPMSQMKTAYDEWMPKNHQSLSKTDLQRYTRQHELVTQICKRYQDGASITQIMELLSFMQATGPPPDAVMDQLSTDGSMDGLLQRLGAFGN